MFTVHVHPALRIVISDATVSLYTLAEILPEHSGGIISRVVISDQTLDDPSRAVFETHSGGVRNENNGGVHTLTISSGSTVRSGR